MICRGGKAKKNQKKRCYSNSINVLHIKELKRETSVIRKLDEIFSVGLSHFLAILTKEMRSLRFIASALSLIFMFSREPRSVCSVLQFLHFPSRPSEILLRHTSKTWFSTVRIISPII